MPNDLTCIPQSTSGGVVTINPEEAKFRSAQYSQTSNGSVGKMIGNLQTAITTGGSSVQGVRNSNGGKYQNSTLGKSAPRQKMIIVGARNSQVIDQSNTTLKRNDSGHFRHTYSKKSSVHHSPDR